MKIQAMSDLHLEFHRDDGWSFIKALDPTGVDVLVLAGDIISLELLKQAENYFRAFAARYPVVLYVLGNHEYYHTNVEETLPYLRNVAEPISNFILLENESATIDGITFHGGTMWWPFHPDDFRYKSGMRDFKVSKGLEPFCHRQHEAFKSHIECNVKKGDVIISHMLPSKKCIAPKYERSPINRFFACEDVEHVIHIQEPELWIHGHSHDHQEMMIANTFVYANPLGYPHEIREQEAFQQHQIITVGE